MSIATSGLAAEQQYSRLALSRAITDYMLARLPVDLADDAVYSAATWNATTLECLAAVDGVLEQRMPTKGAKP